MNKTDISREKIIEVSIALLQQSGAADLNIRVVAQTCGVAVGSIYNYFPTKAELVVAVVGEVWRRVFTPQILRPTPGERFTTSIAAMYRRVYLSQREYHSFFLMHRRLGNSGGTEQGRSAMTQYIGQIKLGLLGLLNADTEVADDIWTAEFSKEQLVDFIFGHLLAALTNDEPSCDFLVTILERLLYKH